MLNYNILGQKIVGSVADKKFAVNFSKELWAKLNKANEDLAKAPSLSAQNKVLDTLSNLTEEASISSTLTAITPNVLYNERTKKYYMAATDGTVASSISIPHILVEKLKYASDKELPVEPLIKFIVRAMRNKKIQDQETADKFFINLCSYAFKTYVDQGLLKFFVEEQGYAKDLAIKEATVYQTPITMEGLLVLKKVVNVDYDQMRYKFIEDEEGLPKKVLIDPSTKTIDEVTGKQSIANPDVAEDWIFYPVCMGKNGGTPWATLESPEAKSHRYHIGTTPVLESHEVDYNDENSASKGFHAGNQDYINNWEHLDNVTLEVLVDPMHIAAIPYGDGNNVVRYIQGFLTGVKSRQIPNKNLYHSSTYAAITDGQWNVMLKDSAKELDNQEAEILEKLQARRDRLQTNL